MQVIPKISQDINIHSITSVTIIGRWRSTMRRMVSLSVVLMLILSGCAATESTGTTPDTPTETPTVTATETSTEIRTTEPSSSNAETATATVSEGTTTYNESYGERTFEVQIHNVQKTNGTYFDFDLKVRANTSIPLGDALSEEDPFFAVAFNGNRITRTEKVSVSENGEYTIDIPKTVLQNHSESTVTVNVTLWEGDTVVDEFVAAQTLNVRIGEINSVTGTATPDSSTDTSTHTPVSATPAPTSTPTSTPTPSPTPSLTPTPTATPTATPLTSERTEWQVTVLRVVDGDTLEVRFPDGNVENVRLLGVDTPEVHTENDPAEFEDIPTNQQGHDWLRDWGHKASEFAHTEVANKEITIRTDPAADRRGSYGRLLVYVYYDGSTSLNKQLITQGYARMYDSSFSKRGAFSSAETTAQQNSVGLWNYKPQETSTPTPTQIPVSDGGTPGALSIVEIHADAEGDDHENLNDEYITFENTGDGELDLSGWSLADEADHVYSFPSVTLGADETVTVYTGSGSDSGGKFYWGESQAVWNNGGDTIIVTSDDDEIVIQRSYSD